MSSSTSFEELHKKLPSNFFGLKTVANSSSTSSSDSLHALAQFVEKSHGHSVIRKVLIANNGIAAVKNIRSVRQWAYATFNNERIIQFVVMATPEDLTANAEYIRMADQVIPVPGGTNNNNYANVDLIVDIAERADVDAVWAGWGHASENPLLPEKLAASKKKVIFIGPPGNAMRSLGDKISSTIVAQHADVPCIPWSGTGVDDVVVNDETKLVSVDDKTYNKCCSTSPEDGLEKAKKIGFPVMIKASEGGGGKGIRKVERAEDFVELYEQAAHEIPGSPIFIMKLAGNARHIEVQILSDQYNNTISLFGRDCSVQRRHQKIIEEAPVTIVPPETFKQMEKAAVRLGNLVGYVSAGTIEYLYSHADNKFYFLELNPRLQVEHPTSEMVSGVNLPAAQLQIAMGIPLHFIRDIRCLYGLDPHSESLIDFDFSNPESHKTQRTPKPKGHTTACRITSEDPENGFKPKGGRILKLDLGTSKNVWGYFSLSENGTIHSFSDSQFGHIFAYGENREESRKHMVVALKELSIRGEFKTTVEYLIKLLETSEFTNNTISTGWLDDLISKKMTSERPEKNVAILCGAVTKAYIEYSTAVAEFNSLLDKGQVPDKTLLKTIYPVDFIYENEKFKFTCVQTSEESFKVFINGSTVDVEARPLSDGGLLTSIGGKAYTVYYIEEPQSTRLLIDGKTCQLEIENDPTQLRTPSPGKLIKYLVENGDHVTAGQNYAQIEVMKMVVSLSASEDGIIQLLEQPGSTVDGGDILAILALDDPSKVKHAKIFEGTVDDFGPAVVAGTKPVYKFKNSQLVLENILLGYDNNSVMKQTVAAFIDVLRNPDLPYSEWKALFSSLESRLGDELGDKLSSIIEKSRAGKKFPARTLKSTILKYTKSNEELKTSCEPLVQIIDKYYNGALDNELNAVTTLLENYYTIEKLFDKQSIANALLSLRSNSDNKTVLKLARSHFGKLGKNSLVSEILAEYAASCRENSTVIAQLKPVLKKLSELESKSSSKVAIKAREILIQCSLPSVKERTDQLEYILKTSVAETRYGEIGVKHKKPQLDVLRDIIDSKYVVFDVLTQFLCHNDPHVALAAGEVYIRRSYRNYHIRDISYDVVNDNTPILKWDFQMLDIANSSKTTGSGAPAMVRAASVSDLSYVVESNAQQPVRTGVLIPTPTIEEMEENLIKGLELLPKVNGSSPNSSTTKIDGPIPNRGVANSSASSTTLTNVANIFVNDTLGLSDEDVLDRISELLKDFNEDLTTAAIRRITFVVSDKVGAYPKYFTFKGPDYKEDKIIRNIEPSLAFQLELKRLSNFDIKPVFTANRNIHIYEAVGKNSGADKRYFTRGIIRTGKIREDISTAEYLTSEANRLMTDILDSLSVLDLSDSDLNHIFINFSAVFNVTPDDVENAFGDFLERFGRRLWRLRVTAAEIRITCTDERGNPYPIRALITNVSGYVVKSEIYQEVKNASGDLVFKSIGNQPGSMHLRKIDEPYSGKEFLQPKRYHAHVLGTSYVYDFPELFRQAVLLQWKKLAPGSKIPENFFSYNELIFDGSNVIEINREAGANQIGMVAFKVSAKTPEFPKGRQFIIVANDITFKIGSFGPQEDLFFYKVTELARKLGLPRIYLSANSGARIGLADDLVALFKVAWKQENKPEKGFEYIYVDNAGKETIDKSSVTQMITERATVNGEVRHIIKSITSDNAGVEALRGSGLIAGVTSRAYKDIFTITLVTARSVGIGAYLVRLGQRAIQVEGQPIILTGAPAINKLLGKEVYSSNLQLGGTSVMYRNGVSHQVASDDLNGVTKIMDWLSYVPAKRDSPLPILPSTDSWDREVSYYPPQQELYDCRWLIEGRELADGTFESGIFDKGSFVETLGGWAQTVVTGRARLGGIPFGVVSVEVKSVQNVIPADPANSDSVENLVNEAGQVWYPNSAFKTAQAIKDFNNGEQLPLMILANWRGFSGGQRDMFNEVLKYGAMIVDALTEYKQPMFIYIPPTGELRGGSWVVLDPTINEDFMEMYSDVDARHNILEPEGLVSIKFRKEKLLKTMARLDKPYADLKKKLSENDLSAEETAKLTEELNARQSKLLNIYHQLAVQFADLHDRAEIIEQKNIIKKALTLENSRRYFYWRIRRLLSENLYLNAINKNVKTSSKLERVSRLRANYPPSLDYDNDRAVAEWIEANGDKLNSYINNLKNEAIRQKLADTLRSNREETVDALGEMFGLLSAEEKAKLAKYFK
ncbi:acetyl-CoA carboxylase [Saccharomycopsis crataegensis]|uniref:Acetyl-CoA carboxylase n=1 Tax=Saccharomycopsis crataegensis TaxID=43959 RepID=A0AAV5QGQ6_9ASCO|nr:acetyl-CoA carboxylase [Saccharomycopsis crataegensis]